MDVVDVMDEIAQSACGSATWLTRRLFPWHGPPGAPLFVCALARCG